MTGKKQNDLLPRVFLPSMFIAPSWQHRQCCVDASPAVPKVIGS